MASNIDHTIPVAGTLADAAALRANFSAAKQEIEALQGANLDSFSSTGAAAGQVPTADGLGGIDWAEPTGGDISALSVPLTGTGILLLPAAATLDFRLTAYDSYSTYILTVDHGTVTRTGDLIHYTAPAYACTATLTVSWGAIVRTLVLTVTANELVAQPEAPPSSFGEPHLGGYYAGAVWDELCTATGSADISTGVKTLTITGAALPLYFGQQVRLAPGPTNAGQVFMEGTVVSRSDTQLTLEITSVEGSGTFSSWVIAARWKVIVAPKSGGENASVMYKNANTAAPATAWTLTSGKRATDAMIAADTATIYPLAHWAASLRTLNGSGLSGYDDWYIPARDELELIWRNLKPVTNANYITQDRYNAAAYTSNANKDDLTQQHGLNRNSDPAGAAYTASIPGQTAAAAFQSTGAEKMEFGSVWYWSSSESSATYAWLQGDDSSDTGDQSNSLKAGKYRARAVRRSIL